MTPSIVVPKCVRALIALTYILAWLWLYWLVCRSSFMVSSRKGEPILLPYNQLRLVPAVYAFYISNSEKDMLHFDKFWSSCHIIAQTLLPITIGYLPPSLQVYTVLKQLTLTTLMHFSSSKGTVPDKINWELISWNRRDWQLRFRPQASQHWSFDACFICQMENETASPDTNHAWSWSELHQAHLCLYCPTLRHTYVWRSDSWLGDSELMTHLLWKN